MSGLMTARRELLQWDWGGLAPGYRRVDYLEGSGTQYIDTGYVPKFAETDEFYLRFAVLNKKTMILFGTNDYGSGNYRAQQPSMNYRLRADIYNTAQHFGYCTDGDWNEYHIANGTVTCLSQSYVYTPSKWADNPNHLYLFAQGTTQASTISIARISSMYYKENGEFVRNLIPCVRESDSKPGMYDTVTGSFYTNIGTGEFTVPAAS